MRKQGGSNGWAMWTCKTRVTHRNMSKEERLRSQEEGTVRKKGK